MYAVSDAYKLAVADSHRKSRIGAVLSYNGNNIALDDNDIIKDTVYVTNQCTNASEYEYGCVYSAECGITIKSNVDRHNLYDGTITLNWSLWTGTEWEPENSAELSGIQETLKTHSMDIIKNAEGKSPLKDHRNENQYFQRVRRGSCYPFQPRRQYRFLRPS